MLSKCKLIGALAILTLLAGCEPDPGKHHDSEDSVLVVRERIDIHSLADAREHSVVIQIAYDPVFPEVELLVCVPRPDDAPREAQGEFIFSFQKGEVRLVSKNVGSVINEGAFETFSLYLHPDFLEKLRVYFEYVDTKNFKAIGELAKSYDISFAQIATELIQMETDLSHGRDRRQPPPLPSCFDARVR